MTLRRLIFGTALATSFSVALLSFAVVVPSYLFRCPLYRSRDCFVELREGRLSATYHSNRPRQSLSIGYTPQIPGIVAPAARGVDHLGIRAIRQPMWNGEVRWEVGVALVWPIVLLGFVPLAYIRLGVRARRRRSQRRCANCGYDMRFSSERCPECGTDPTATTPIGRPIEPCN